MFATLRRIAAALETLAMQRVREMDNAVSEQAALRVLSDTVNRLGMEIQRSHADHVAQCLRWQQDIQRALERHMSSDDAPDVPDGRVH